MSKDPTIGSEVRQLLDKFKEDTEDLWEQFMEGEDPDPQRYDDFLDNAYKDAAHTLTNLIAQEANKASVSVVTSALKACPTKDHMLRLWLEQYLANVTADKEQADG